MLSARPKRTVLPEYKVAAMTKSRFIILHYGTFKSIWDWLVLVATLYIAIVVPYNVAVGPEKHTVTTVLDIMVEVLFLTGKLCLSKNKSLSHRSLRNNTFGKLSDIINSLFSVRNSKAVYPGVLFCTCCQPIDCILFH